MINEAYDTLSHALRRLTEAYYTGIGDLMQIDRNEAIGNIDAALTSLLNAFHSLSDAIAIEAPGEHQSWYRNAPLATITAIRNARHHNKANRIRSLFHFHNRSLNAEAEAPYLIVDYPPSEQGGNFGQLALSWEDMDHLLMMDREERRFDNQAAVLIRDYLRVGPIKQRETAKGSRFDASFFNVFPLITAAGLTVTKRINRHIQPLSQESADFRMLFIDMPDIDTTKARSTISRFSFQ